MNDRLQGKVIVIAGAGGIGDELARRYAREGASIVLGDVDGDRAIAVCEEIAQDGAAAQGTWFDGGDEASIKAMIDLARATYGKIDGVHVNYIASASADSMHDVTDIPMEDFDQIVQVGIRGYMLCTRYAVPAMLASGGGSIVYTSSDSAYVGEEVRLAYAMSKSAVHALARHVARRFGLKGIRANVVCPGLIRHSRLEAVMSGEMLDERAEANPVGRLGRPLDIAAMGALLMADEGSFINGQTISVNGGSLMRA